MTQSEYQQRVKQVQKWLKASGWQPDAATFDYMPIKERAKQKWYRANPERARQIVAKAARLLRGETVREAGRPTQYAVFRVPVRSKLIYLRQSFDMTINEQRVIEALNGDGNEIEFQDGDGVVISIYVPHDDE